MPDSSRLKCSAPCPENVLRSKTWEFSAKTANCDRLNEGSKASGDPFPCGKAKGIERKSGGLRDPAPKEGSRRYRPLSVLRIQQALRRLPPALPSPRGGGSPCASKSPRRRLRLRASESPRRRLSLRFRVPEEAALPALPSPRGGDSDSALPSPRGGDSDSALPSPRGGGSDSALPSPRGGGSDSALPSPRGGDSALRPKLMPLRSLSVSCLLSKSTGGGRTYIVKLVADSEITPSSQRKRQMYWMNFP